MRGVAISEIAGSGVFSQIRGALRDSVAFLHSWRGRCELRQLFAHRAGFHLFITALHIMQHAFRRMAARTENYRRDRSYI